MTHEINFVKIRMPTAYLAVLYASADLLYFWMTKIFIYRNKDWKGAKSHKFLSWKSKKKSENWPIFFLIIRWELHMITYNVGLEILRPEAITKNGVLKPLALQQVYYMNYDKDKIYYPYIQNGDEKP